MKRRLQEAARNAQLWLPEYLDSRLARRTLPPPARAWLVIADHFEPHWRRPGAETARARVAAWRNALPPIAQRQRDAAGRPLTYTFFYPQEEYEPELLEPLAEMARQGIADVEVHLHHDGEGQQDFVDRINGFTFALETRHGLLRRREGRPAFGFIHGNWALDNARPDGRWCGLNNEISLLKDLGCYADFTLPCVPDASQAGPVNVIYWATDDPQPRSHDKGVALRPGDPPAGDLLMIPGPLGLSWEGRPPWKPRVETGELAAQVPATRRRARLWLSRGPQIGEDVFIKLFTHGAQEKNSTSLLGGDLDRAVDALRAECAEGGVALYFVSAWEAWRVVEALRQRQDPRRAFGSG